LCIFSAEPQFLPLQLTVFVIGTSICWILVVIVTILYSILSSTVSSNPVPIFVLLILRDMVMVSLPALLIIVIFKSRILANRKSSSKKDTTSYHRGQDSKVKSVTNLHSAPDSPASDPPAPDSPAPMEEFLQNVQARDQNKN